MGKKWVKMRFLSDFEASQNWLFFTFGGKARHWHERFGQTKNLDHEQQQQLMRQKQVRSQGRRSTSLLSLTDLVEAFFYEQFFRNFS